MEESTISKLQLIAFYLPGDWKVNTLLTTKRNYYLQDKTGLFINITYKYKCTLPQWSLLVRNQRYYDNFQTIATIGCSLDKSVQAIVVDLKGRLLCHSEEAHKTIEENKGKKQDSLDLMEQRRHVMAAINTVVRIDHEATTHWNHSSLINEDGNKLGLLTHIHDKVDQFHLDLYWLTSEQVIKIMDIIGGTK